MHTLIRTKNMGEALYDPQGYLLAKRDGKIDLDLLNSVGIPVAVWEKDYVQEWTNGQWNLRFDFPFEQWTEEERTLPCGDIIYGPMQVPVMTPWGIRCERVLDMYVNNEGYVSFEFSDGWYGKEVVASSWTNDAMVCI